MGTSTEVQGSEFRVLGSGFWVRTPAIQVWVLFKWIHLSPVLGMLAGGVISVVVAALLGYLALRLRGIYFSITTISFAEALSVIWLMTPGVTGGAMGLSTPPLFGGDRQQAYYLILGILIFCVLVVWMIEVTRLNFAFPAIRENEEVANVMGINPTRYKVLAFMISAFFTGFAGGFYSHYNTYIIPYEVFGLGISIACLVMPIFGGLYTIGGPILGTVIVKAIDAWQSFPASSPTRKEVAKHAAKAGLRTRE